MFSVFIAPDRHSVVTSPLSEIGDVVHMFFSLNKSMKYCDFVHITPYKICTKYFIYFKMKPTNPTPKHKRIFWCILNDFQHLKDLAQGL